MSGLVYSIGVAVGLSAAIRHRNACAAPVTCTPATSPIATSLTPVISRLSKVRSGRWSSQTANVHVVSASVPYSSSTACCRPPVGIETDLLGEFAPGHLPGRLTASHGAAWEIAFAPIRRTQQQQRLLDVDRYERTLMPLSARPPARTGPKVGKPAEEGSPARGNSSVRRLRLAACRRDSAC